MELILSTITPRESNCMVMYIYIYIFSFWKNEKNIIELNELLLVCITTVMGWPN